MGSRQLAQQTICFVAPKMALVPQLQRLKLMDYSMQAVLPDMQSLAGRPDAKYVMGQLSAVLQPVEDENVFQALGEIRVEIADRSPEDAVVAVRFAFEAAGDASPARVASQLLPMTVIYETVVTQDGELLAASSLLNGTVLSQSERYVSDPTWCPSASDPVEEAFRQVTADLSKPMPQQ